jgi:hypothetical protein
MAIVGDEVFLGPGGGYETWIKKLTLKIAP